jgi:hypothetical protein
MNPSTQPVMTLSQALAQARQHLQAQLPPPDLATQLQARVAAARGPSRPAARWAWSGAFACALLLVGSVALMLGHPDKPQMASGGERMAGFLPLVPEEDWPAGDAPAWLVNTEIRRDRLVAMGLPFDPARAGDSVRAELLVRPSGEVLAVRFLQ